MDGGVVEYSSLVPRKALGHGVTYERSKRREAIATRLGGIPINQELQDRPEKCSERRRRSEDYPALLRWEAASDCPRSHPSAQSAAAVQHAPDRLASQRGG